METNFQAAIEKSAESTGSIALLLDLYRDEILRLVDHHGAHNVRIFGSVARGQTDADSDLDLLVEFDADRSLLDRIALMQDLKDLLGIDVDVVTPRSLHRDLQAQILRDAQPL
jgi:predicted nucleotidyltransferase